MEKIRLYEPNVVKAAWNIFGKSYEYRMRYNEYKENRRTLENKKKIQETVDIEGQMSIFDFPECLPEKMKI